MVPGTENMAGLDFNNRWFLAQKNMAGLDFNNRWFLAQKTWLG